MLSQGGGGRGLRRGWRKGGDFIDFGFQRGRQVSWIGGYEDMVDFEIRSIAARPSILFRKQQAARTQVSGTSPFSFQQARTSFAMRGAVRRIHRDYDSRVHNGRHTSIQTRAPKAPVLLLHTPLIYKILLQFQRCREPEQTTAPPWAYHSELYVW